MGRFARGRSIGVYLKRLVIRGFKSFAERTELELERGVTVVVGPNGSGKSNVVDAVAWVLGAQGALALRGGKMDDVIFAGAEQRAALWKARKTAFGALGRAAPTCITQDGVVPRSELPHILRFVRQVADKHHLRVASNFHAGDGNIHPNFLFDRRDPRKVDAVQQASHEILAECVRVGGSVTGEHGIGVEKTAALRLMFNDADLAAQRRLKAVFDPAGRANSDKVFASEERQATPTES